MVYNNFEVSKKLMDSTIYTYCVRSTSRKSAPGLIPALQNKEIVDNKGFLWQWPVRGAPNTFMVLE